MPRPTPKAPTSPATYTRSSPSASSSSSKPPAQPLLQSATAANNSAASSSSRSGGGGGVGVGAAQHQHQACAACKYQRRRCNADCSLAAYFPAEQQRRFLNAHRLFGVSNIQKTLRRTRPELRPDAMRALIFESEARAFDPVGGCCRITLNLRFQLHAELSFLENLTAQLVFYRNQHLATEDNTGMLLTSVAVSDEDAGVVDQYFFTENQMQQPAQHQQSYDYLCNNISSYDGTAGGEQDPNSVQRQYENGAADVNTGSSATLGEQQEQHCQIDTQLYHVLDMNPETNAIMQHAGNSSWENTEEKKLRRLY